MNTRYALDENGNTVHISQTHTKNNYFCPCCDEKLILKKGEINVHHFSHAPGSRCSDTWSYDMSEWHEEWQNRFPKENREVVLTSNGKKHRADVLIDNTVIEFQHSSLSSNEFEQRNDFYISLGYNVIWIFDVADLYESGAISFLNDDSDTKYKWRRPFKTFDYFDPKDKKIELYLQISNEDEEYFEYWGESKATLIKVDWIAPSGMERFVCNNSYGPENILDRFMPKEKEPEPEQLCDLLFSHYSKDHTNYMYGCPLSKTHYAISSIIDTPKEDYDKYMPCELCEFSLTYRGFHACNQRFKDSKIQIPSDAKILKIARDLTGQVTDIAIQHGEKRYVAKIASTIPPLGDTILNVWKKVNPRNVLILQN